MKPSKGMKKKYEYSAKMSTTSSDNLSSEEEDENESDGEEEICSLTKEEIIKTKPSEMWAVDTGATSSMTDNRDFFTDIRRIKHIPIQVGRGKLYSNDLGTVRMDGLDGSTGLFSNVLGVPNLGVNLLLARSVCKYGGFTRSFDDNEMYIMKENTVKIYELLDRGLDVFNHIAHEYRQTAFRATLQPIHKLRRKDQQEAFTSNTKSLETNEEIMTPKEFDTSVYTNGNADTDAYIEISSDSDSEKPITKHQILISKVMNLRFGHFGPNVLRHLHQIAQLKEKIRIRKSRDICEPCQLANIKNKISRKLSPRKTDILELITIDIAGAFLTSLRGNIVMMEIVDNSSRKNWSIPMKSNDEAIPQLYKFKLREELQTGKKIKRTRTDNCSRAYETITRMGANKWSCTRVHNYSNIKSEWNRRTEHPDIRENYESYD
jgi:hypothetical protein